MRGSPHVLPSPWEGAGEALETLLSDRWIYAFVPLEHCLRTTRAMLTDYWSIAYGLLELCSRVPKPLLFHAEKHVMKVSLRFFALFELETWNYKLFVVSLQQILLEEEKWKRLPLALHGILTYSYADKDK